MKKNSQPQIELVAKKKKQSVAPQHQHANACGTHDAKHHAKNDASCDALESKNKVLHADHDHAAKALIKNDNLQKSCHTETAKHEHSDSEHAKHHGEAHEKAHQGHDHSNHAHHQAKAPTLINKLKTKLHINQTHDHHEHHNMPGMENMTHLMIPGEPWKVWTRYGILIVIFLFYTFMMIAMPKGNVEYALHWGIWLPFTSYVVFFEGRQLFQIYPKLLKGKVDMYTLIGLASHLIFIYCVVNVGLKWNVLPYQAALPWEAPALVIVVAMAGDYIESKMHSSVTKAIGKLHAMRNQSVLLLKDGVFVKTKLNDVKIGDFIQVAKGDLVLLDGTLLSEANFDYANITGEAKKQQLKANATVLSGAFNVGEAVLVKVTTLVENSTLFKIVDSFFKAALVKPALQRTVDKILKVFVLSVLTMALITFIVWLSLGLTQNLNVPWNPNVGTVNTPAEAWRVAIEVGVTVLAIACPCALGMATPIISLITAQGLNKRGIIINKAAAIENLAAIKTVAFDKTGTLTTDALSVSQYQATAEQIAIAKSLESGIKHPIAYAFNNLPGTVVKLTKVQLIDSVGVKGTYNNIDYQLRGIKESKLSNLINATLIGLFANEKLVAEFALTNELRLGTKATIAYLKSRGLKTIMLTGDQSNVAQALGVASGIDDVKANLSPNDKLVLINKLRQTGSVLFIGDGFNDALASQAADISAAFASGSDIVNNAADFSLTNERFDVIGELFTLSKLHTRTVKVSLTWALLFNVIALPVAMLFLVPPWAGALLMTLSNLLVVANALSYQWRLNRRQQKNSLLFVD